MSSHYFSSNARWFWVITVLFGLLLLGRPSHAQITNTAGTIFSNTGTLATTGTFQNAGTFVPTSGTFTINAGDFSNTGTITSAATTGTVALVDASAAHTLTLGTQALPSLTLNVPAGTTLTNSGTVTTALTLTAGNLNTTTSNTLTLGSAAVISGETSAQYVIGRLAQSKALTGSTTVDYGNMGVTVNPGGQNFTLGVERRAGLGTAVSVGQNPSGTNKGIDCIWSFTAAANPTTPVAIVLTWFTANNNGLTFSTGNAQVWRSDNGGTSWVMHGTTATATATGSGTTATQSMTVTTSSLTSSLFTVSTTAAPLPVTLVAFTGKVVQDEGVLSWRTASEVNSAWFEVQQSANGQTDWAPLSRVAAAGLSSAPRTYGYTDVRLSRYGVPVVYYRLRQFDADGTASYSPVVSLSPAAAVLAVEVWPNPAASASQLSLTAPGTTPVAVAVYDATGRLVYQQVSTPGATLALPSAAWATGTYVIRATQGTRTVVQHLVRQ